MPTWSELLRDLERKPVQQRGQFLQTQSRNAMSRVSRMYGGNVLFYASSFLQKPEQPAFRFSITMEDLNGVMAGLHGLDFNKKLLLILHTPGGQAEAAQTIVEYLRSKFDRIDALIPTYAMSAGTMIALGCDSIIMGRQSQLGPTDPQIVVGNQQFSAHSIVEQFEVAKGDLETNPAYARAWAPILGSFGPGLLQEARKSIGYGRSLVKEWLQEYMFATEPDPESAADDVSRFFSSNDHGSHGRRINREAARMQMLNIVDLEDNQKMQDEVLTLYHLTTIAFEQGPALKSIQSSNGQLWVKNVAQGPAPAS